MVKAIFFDFDGVLTVDKTGSQSITDFISEKSGIPLDMIRASYYKYNKALLFGEITHQDMWESFCNDIGKRLNYSMLTEAFHQTRLDNDMISFVKELKSKYLIGMITDNKCDRIRIILDFNNLEQYFDVVSISSEVHSGKNEKAIFDKAIQKLNVLAEECVFIDNMEKNLMIPKQMGMHTILFDDVKRDYIEFKQNLYSLIKLT